MLGMASGLSQAWSQGAEDKPRQLSFEERADIFMARKSYASAAEFYSRALKQAGPSDAALWNKLGIAYQEQTDYRRARRAYEESIRRNKEFAEPLNNLGTVYFMEGKYRKSIKCYNRAIRLLPSSASFHLNLGTSYFHRKRLPEAFEEFRTALGLDPDCLTEHSSMATVVQARGTADVDFWFYLAKAFASMGRVEESVRYLRRAFEDGLKDHKRLEDDPDFRKISHEPAYIELINNLPTAIKD